MADAAASHSLSNTFGHAVFNWHTVFMSLMVFAMVPVTGATFGDFFSQAISMFESMLNGLAAAPTVAGDMISNAMSGNWAATSTAVGPMHAGTSVAGAHSTAAMGSTMAATATHPVVSGTASATQAFTPAASMPDPATQEFLKGVSKKLPVSPADVQEFWPAKH